MGRDRSHGHARLQKGLIFRADSMDTNEDADDDEHENGASAHVCV